MNYVANNTSQPRTCGECTACCIATAVEPLGKPCGERCSYLGQRGCSVYFDRHKDPKFRDCISFNCLWILGWAEEQDRPDKLGGVVFSAQPDPDCPDRARIQIMERTPGSSQSPRVQYIIDQVLQQGVTVMITNREYGVAINQDRDSWKYIIDPNDPLHMRPHPNVAPVQLTIRGKPIGGIPETQSIST